MKGKTPFTVLQSPALSPADEARLHLRVCAHELHTQAAESHAEGVYFARQSARLDQLAEILSDDEVVKIRDSFVEEGAMEIISTINAPVGNA